jgi:hypothetical protein
MSDSTEILNFLRQLDAKVDSPGARFDAKIDSLSVKIDQIGHEHGRALESASAGRLPAAAGCDRHAGTQAGHSKVIRDLLHETRVIRAAMSGMAKENVMPEKSTSCTTMSASCRWPSRN